jgi:hypothetical protein
MGQMHGAPKRGAVGATARPPRPLDAPGIAYSERGRTGHRSRFGRARIASNRQFLKMIQVVCLKIVMKYQAQIIEFQVVRIIVGCPQYPEHLENIFALQLSFISPHF